MPRNGSKDNAMLFGAAVVLVILLLSLVAYQQYANGQNKSPGGGSSTIPVGGNTTIAVNLTQEMANSEHDGFVLNESMFYATSASQCSKQLISACDNNVPSQFICINRQYEGSVAAQHSRIYSVPVACPMFIEAGNVTCGLENNYCVVMHSPTNLP